MTIERRRALIGVNAGIFLAHIGNFIWFPVLVASSAAPTAASGPVS